MPKFFAVLGTLLFALLTSCGGSGGTRAELVNRASFEMSCPREQLHVYVLGDDTRGVEGCGRRATYIRSCKGGGAMEECVWVLNSPPNGQR